VKFKGDSRSLKHWTEASIDCETTLTTLKTGFRKPGYQHHPIIPQPSSLSDHTITWHRHCPQRRFLPEANKSSNQQKQNREARSHRAKSNQRISQLKQGVRGLDPNCRHKMYPSHSTTTMASQWRQGAASGLRP